MATAPLLIHSGGESLEVVTAVINRQGALILCPVNWPQGARLTIDSKKTGLRICGRVVLSGSKEPTGFQKLGVEFESVAPELWAGQYDPKEEEGS